MRISDWSSDVCSSDLAAIFDALALIGRRLPPAADFSRHLADLLLVVARNFDRGLIRRLDRDALGHIEIDVVAVAKLQLQRLALRRGAIADAGDLQNLGETVGRSEEHTSELQSLMRISYAVFCLKKKNTTRLQRQYMHTNE